MSIVAIYEMSYCPQMLTPASENELQSQKNQEMIWETAKWFCVNDQTTPLELCTIAKPNTQSVHIFLLVHSTDGNTGKKPTNEWLESFERLLPGDYGWKRFDKKDQTPFADSRELFQKILSDQKLDESSFQWHTSSLRRKFHLSDIAKGDNNEAVRKLCDDYFRRPSITNFYVSLAFGKPMINLSANQLTR